MRKQFGFGFAVMVFVLAVSAAMTVQADVTVITRYTLVNGDTLTRASYYSPKRIRVTAPDGREYMFSAKSDQVTVIDHATRRYWTGSKSQADSIASRMIAANRQEIAAQAAADPVAWGEKVKAFNDAIRVERTGRSRKIAGYPVDELVLTAGPLLRDERWIAAGLNVANYGPEMQKVIMASIKDPLGRQYLRMMIDTRTKSGLPLAGRTRFKTLTQEGMFEYEAVQVIGKTIPSEAWNIPEGYTQIQL